MISLLIVVVEEEVHKSNTILLSVATEDGSNTLLTTVPLPHSYA